jgi:hypothetical protein
VQVAPAASDTQQSEPEPQPAGGGSTKADRERQRKERQRQRKIEEAKEALQVAIEAMLEEAAGSVKAVEEATAEAAKHASRSEPLAALVAEAKGLLEQARAAEAERAKVAAEEAAVKAAAEATERLRLEEDLAALTLRMQSDAQRMRTDALRAQQMQVQLGVPPAAPAPRPDGAEGKCVLCFDAPKDHIILPCFHMCVCEACANLLTQMEKPSCPICRTAIQQTNKVFQS